jgi:hypothetical protein
MSCSPRLLPDSSRRLSVLSTWALLAGVVAVANLTALDAGADSLDRASEARHASSAKLLASVTTSQTSPSAPPTALPAGAPTVRPATAPTPTPAPVQAPAESQAPSADQAADEASDEPLDELPPITLDPPVLDFGIVPPSVTKVGVVKLINTGTKELEILTVQPSCKCTTLEDLSGKKIPVGGFIELKAEMKAQSSPGGKKADVKVLIDGYTQVINVVLRNEVSLPVRISPAYLNVVQGQAQTGRLIVESIDKKPFKICAVGGKPPNLVGFDPAKDEPRNQYLLDWDFKRDFPDGVAPRYLVIETDRADSPLVDVFVRHESTFPNVRFKFADYRHTFGRMEEGGSHEFIVEVNELAAGERIATAATGSSNAKVEFLGAETEGTLTKINLRVTPNSGVLGLLYVPFTIYSNQRQQELTVWGQVVPKGTTGCFGR